MSDEREYDTVFEPLVVDECELERQRVFEEYITYLKYQMCVGLTVPKELYYTDDGDRGRTLILERKFNAMVRKWF